MNIIVIMVIFLCNVKIIKKQRKLKRGGKLYFKELRILVRLTNEEKHGEHSFIKINRDTNSRKLLLK